MNVDKKLVLVYGVYEGEKLTEIGKDMWKVKYVKDGTTLVNSFLSVDLVDK